MRPRIKPLENCLNCGEICNRQSIKYCSNKCQQEHQYNNFIELWLKNEISANSGKYDISRYVRKYLFRKYNYSCQLCGWNKVNIYTNSIPLEIHHIDGDSTNNKHDNLQLICPCCHSLTSTHGILNKGKGRRYIKIEI